MANTTRFLLMSWFIVLMLVIINLISAVAGNRFGPFPMGRGGPFGTGGLRGLAPFGGGGFGGLGPFGGAGPFDGGSLGFPINSTFLGLNITLPAINGSFLGFPSLSHHIDRTYNMLAVKALHRLFSFYRDLA